jgi:alpha-amylase
MLADGIPIIYQGQEQHFSGGSVPQNREILWPSGYSKTSTLYPFITKLNQLRTQAIKKDSNYVTTKASSIYSDASTIVMRKGVAGSQVVGVFSNKGASGSSSFTLASAKSGFTAGQSLTDILSCKTYTADSSGNVVISITGGAPLALYSTSRLSGSGLCVSTGNSARDAPSTTLSTVVLASTPTPKQ